MNETKLASIPEFIIRIDAIDDEIKQNLRDLPVCSTPMWFKYLNLHDKKNRLHLRTQRVVEELIKVIHPVSHANQEHSIMPLVEMYRTALAVSNRPTTDFDNDLNGIYEDLKTNGTSMEKLNNELKALIYTKCLNQPKDTAPRSTPKDTVVKLPAPATPKLPPKSTADYQPKQPAPHITQPLVLQRQMPSRIETYNISLNLPIAKPPASPPVKQRTRMVKNSKGDITYVPIDEVSNSLPSSQQKNLILPLPR